LRVEQIIWKSVPDKDPLPAKPLVPKTSHTVDEGDYKNNSELIQSLASMVDSSRFEMATLKNHL
jgi:hypothetical protein